MQATAVGQHPLAVVLSCIDSRTPSELIFDLGLGDIFSIRIAGNITSPKVLGSLEYGCAVAGAKLIVVIGHTQCGAVTAAVNLSGSPETAEQATGCQHLESIIHEIQLSIGPQDCQPLEPRPEQEQADFINTVARNVCSSVELILQQVARSTNSSVKVNLLWSVRCTMSSPENLTSSPISRPQHCLPSLADRFPHEKSRTKTRPALEEFHHERSLLFLFARRFDGRRNVGRINRRYRRLASLRRRLEQQNESTAPTTANRVRVVDVLGVECLADLRLHFLQVSRGVRIEVGRSFLEDSLHVRLNLFHFDQGQIGDRLAGFGVDELRRQGQFDQAIDVLLLQVARRLLTIGTRGVCGLSGFLSASPDVGRDRREHFRQRDRVLIRWDRQLVVVDATQRRRPQQ